MPYPKTIGTDFDFDFELECAAIVIAQLQPAGNAGNLVENKER